MDLRRPKFTALMDDTQDGRVATLVAAHEDRLAIVDTFSCRLYGLRRYRKTLKDRLSEDTSR